MIYLYRDKKGNIVEISMPFAEMMKREKPDGTLRHKGKTLRRDIVSEHSTKGLPASKGWPMECDALAVHPSQVKDQMAHDRKMGVNVGYSPEGSVIFENKAQKDKYLKAHGFHDRN